MDITRPMQARFHRWPNFIYAAAAWLAAGALLVAWTGNFDTLGLKAPLRQVAVAGRATGTALLFLFGGVFLRMALVARAPALAIDDRGVHFGTPDIGVVPWSRVERTEFFDMGGQRRFGVVTSGPAPRMKAARRPRGGFAWDAVDDGVRISMPLNRLDIGEEQIARTVRWFAPPVMRMTSGADAATENGTR